MRNLFLALCFASLLGACSGEDTAQTPATVRGDHVWKNQTELLDRARDVEAVVLDANSGHRQQLDDMAQ